MDTFLIDAHLKYLVLEIIKFNFAFFPSKLISRAAKEVAENKTNERLSNFLTEAFNCFLII